MHLKTKLSVHAQHCENLIDLTRDGLMDFRSLALVAPVDLSAAQLEHFRARCLRMATESIEAAQAVQQLLERLAHQEKRR